MNAEPRLHALPRAGTCPAKTICLYNPISRQGHLDSYARLYARALVELGHRVLLVAQGDAGTPDYLARTCPERADAFSFVDFDAAEAAMVVPPPDVDWSGPEWNHRGHLPAYRRARLVWQTEGLPGLARRAYAVPLRLLRPYVPRVALNAFRPVMQRFMPGAGRPRFAWLVNRVAGAAKVSGLSPDLVMVLYLDMMCEDRRDIAVLDRDDAPAWTGILFHPRGVRTGSPASEPYFHARSAHGAIFLVPDAAPTYARRHPRLHFALAPDVADLERDPRPHPLAEAMRARANGRTIVLAIGTMAPHKGIDTLLRVIGAADPERFFFALIGAVHWQSFGAFADTLRAFHAAPPANVLVHDGYVEEERAYNTLIGACDIVYAVYKGFDSSSNSLTKAAGFEKPILVAEGTLMGARVEAARIGAVAAEGDAPAIMAALERLAAAPPERFGFATYRAEHSLDRLQQVLDDAIGTWCRRAPLSAAADG